MGGATEVQPGREEQIKRVKNHGGRPMGGSGGQDGDSELETERGMEIRTHNREGRARRRDKV